MNIAYNLADQVFSRGKSIGILNLSLNLLRHLAEADGMDAITVFANHSLADLLPTHARVRCAWHEAPAHGRLQRLWWDQRGLYRAARAIDPDWLVLPKGFASLAQSYRRPMAAYVHDTMASYYREHYPSGLSPLELLYFERSLLATLRQARVVFTNSEFTAREVARLARAHDVSAPDIVPAGMGFAPDDVQFAASPGVAVARRSGILALASRWPHKRTAMAVDYLHRWQAHARFDEPVSWVGAWPEGVAVPRPANWNFLPRLDHAAYAALLHSVRAVVFTSEYEGFGMPPVEAVLAGAGPAFSDIPVLREVMQRTETAFANDDYSRFVEALNRALALTPDELARWADDLRRRHAWPTVCARVVDALRRRA